MSEELDVLLDCEKGVANKGVSAEERAPAGGVGWAGVWRAEVEEGGGGRNKPLGDGLEESGLARAIGPDEEGELPLL